MTAGPMDVDLARAESTGMRDLRMVLDDLLARGVPSAAEEFPWPVLVHDGVHIVHTNPACLRWLRCGGDGDLLGRELEVLSTPEDWKALRAALGASAEEPPVAPHVQRFVNREGDVAIGRVLSRRTYSGSSLTCALIEPGSTADRSLDLLRLLEAAVDQLSDIVFITEATAIDEVGRRIVFVNRAFTRSSGFEASEVLGKTPNVTIGPDTDRGTLARMEAALLETRAVREELLKYGKEGAPYWVEIDIIPVFDERQQHTHWVSVQRDITERKKLELRVLESAKLAAAGGLSASLASEINTPLASVVSSLEWLSERLPSLCAKVAARDPAEQSNVLEVLEALSDARAGARRVAAATSYLQLLATPAPEQRQTVHLEQALDSAVTEACRSLPLTASIERTYESSVSVAAHGGRLSHALRLAFSNAVLASASAARGGAIHLGIRRRGDSAVVTIDDAGTGITEEMRGELSLPFGTRKPQGIGDALGLFVAGRLVAELGGELCLSRRDTGGTRVEIRLPLSTWASSLTTRAGALGPGRGAPPEGD